MAVHIGKNFHLIHMTDDLRAMDAWYYDVFSVRRSMPPNYLSVEMRDALLVLLGDLCIETLAPAFRYEGWDQMPLGRFFKRHGNRFHSLAWYVDEGYPELYQDFVAAGVRCYGSAGVKEDGDEVAGMVFFTHPKDTYTQLEFMPTPAGGGDDRFNAGWSASWWADMHPLRIQKASHATLLVRDLAAARDMYTKVLGGTLLYEGDVAHYSSQSAFVLVGDLVVELAQPRDETSPLVAELEAHGEGISSFTYKVSDLARAATFLDIKGVRLASNDGTTMLSDPTTTQGAVMGFTTWSIPNDPRPDWTAFPDGGNPRDAFNIESV